MKAIKSIQKVMMLLAAAAVLTSGPLFAATLYFPHVISGEVWETEIGIINSDAAQPLSGTLRAFGDDGQEATQRHSVTLPANGRAELKVGDVFLQPQNIGYLVLETDSAGFTGYSRFYISGRYSAAVPAAAEAGGGDIYISHIASDENWWTLVSLVNTTEALKEITFEFNDGSAADWTLPAKGRVSMTAAQLFGGQMPEGVESAVIKNAAGVVGLEIFGSHDSSTSSYLGGILLKDERTGTLYFPHIASDANWWSGIAVFNPGEADCDLTITPYAADGTALTTQTAEIGPFGRYIGLVSSLNLSPQAAWVKLKC